MGLACVDVGAVLFICQANLVRVSYGVLGASIMRKVGKTDASYEDYGNVTAGFIKKYFEPGSEGGMCPTASWGVSTRTGYPTGYGPWVPGNTKYDPNWSPNTRFFPRDENGFIDWLNDVYPQWSATLQSTWP
jgi:hypothetical protein